MNYLLAKQGVFRTIQGEGHLAGVPMIFIRLGGCSVGCQECDTDYKTVEKVSVNEVVKRVESLSVGKDWVWLTGGEPTDQNLIPLVEELRHLQHKIAIATAGVRSLNRKQFDWISVSPHGVDLIQKTGDEVKIVPGLNGLSWSVLETMNFSNFTHKFVQSLWGNPEQTKHCVDFVLRNPEWRLTIQGHKYWEIL